MAIPVSDNGGGFTRELIEPGLYLAICYQMVEIGTVKTSWQGKDKQTRKVRLTWELPDVRKVFKPENGEQARVISKEYTASLGENSMLRKDLKSWRGKDFTPEELERFDLENVLGKPCMLNIGHYTGKDGKTYEEINSVNTLPKGYPVPAQENRTVVLSYDAFDWEVYNSLPQFLRDKISETPEFRKISAPHETTVPAGDFAPVDSDDLPF